MNGIVSDTQGRDFLLYHAYHAKDSVYVGRQGLLDEVTWGADDWPVISEVAFTGKEKVEINPKFFQRMDERINAVNDHGMVAAVVLLWAIQGDENPGSYLPEDQIVKLHESKQQLANSLLAGGDAVGGLDAEELLELVTSTLAEGQPIEEAPRRFTRRTLASSASGDRPSMASKRHWFMITGTRIWSWWMPRS